MAGCLGRDVIKQLRIPKQSTSQPNAEQPSGNSDTKPGNEEVTDVDFEEVK